MVHFERAFERSRRDGTSCGYVARVRVCVRANAITIVREGTGFGEAFMPRAADAYERALKTAETDATKRALATFGSRFGLMLYDKEQRPAPGTGTLRSQVTGQSTGARDSSAEASKRTTAYDSKLSGAQSTSAAASRETSDDPSQSPAATSSGQAGAMYRLVASDGSVIEPHSPEGFCSGLRQLLDAASDCDEVLRLQHNNALTISTLRDVADLTTQRGEHYADILERLIAQRCAALAAVNESTSGTMAEPPAGAQDAHAPDIGVANTVETAATRAAVLGDSAERAPSGATPFYGPFVPVPDYPLTSLKDRVVRAGRPARPEPHVGQVRRGVSQDDDAVSLKTESAPTRRSQITGGFSIDKSALLVPSERRLRSKAHLQFVASRPCLVCEVLPCHAHHLTFAQPRGLSQKVSDEFTVPLCAVHHNQLHAFGNEASWWRAQAIEPLASAQALWHQTWSTFSSKDDKQC